MNKTVLLCYITVIVLISSIFVGTVIAAEEYDEDVSAIVSAVNDTNVFELKAKSAILVDAATGSILYEKNIHEKLPIASITKVMSMLLVMEAVDSGKLSLDEMVPVTENAYGFGGSQVYLKPGEEFTAKEMLKAIAIHSANDATVAIAEKIAGTEEMFVKMMNDKATQLGMVNTNFLDCSGLTDDGHYSSAYDITLMSKELVLRHPTILEYTSIWMDTFRDGTFGLVNRNKLVRHYEGANGLKTGYTDAAGHCVVASAKRNNLQLISVVLGEPTSAIRFAEASKLLNFGFANFESIKLNAKGEEVQRVVVKRGLDCEVKAVYESDVSFIMKKGSKDNVERILSLEESICAPVAAGEKLGEIIYTVNGKEIGRAVLVSDREVKKASFLKLMSKMVVKWFGLGRC